MKNLSAHLSLLGGSAIWACSFPLYNIVMPRYIEPLPLFTATIIVTALLSLTSLLGSAPRETLPRRDILSMIGAALLIAILRKFMLLYGLSLTSPIDGSIIGTVAPVVVLIISVAVGAELFSTRKLMGVLLGFGGAVGVILSGGAGGAKSQVWGNVMILLCAFIAAIYMVWFKDLLSRYRPSTVLRWMFCIAAIIFTPIGARSLIEVDPSNWTPQIWLAVAYLVVMPTYIPNLLLTSGLSKVSPTIASIYTYLQPVGAVTLSVAFGLDKLRLETVLFALLIFVGVWLVIGAAKRRG
ncbi:MAG: DMT family transporter [Rikenellaceae bacterium]